MFGGADAELSRIMAYASRSARELGHPRVGSEHLLLGLALSRGAVAGILTWHGATSSAIRGATCAAAPAGAGAAADRGILAVLGIDLDPVLDQSGPAVLDRPVGPVPVFPLGASRARARCARMSPPLGADAQAAWEAALRLALARHERRHGSEHLALALVTLDPGASWVLTETGADRKAVLASLIAAFPRPAGHPLLRTARRLGHRSRHRDIVRRYQRLTGRIATDGAAVAQLIAG
jgi:hypothetical protein